MSVWTRVSWNRVTPGGVTLLASRQPVASRFLAACHERRNQGEHVALSCLGRYFEAERHPPCLPAQYAIIAAFTNPVCPRFASELTVRRPEIGAPSERFYRHWQMPPWQRCSMCSWTKHWTKGPTRRFVLPSSEALREHVANQDLYGAFLVQEYQWDIFLEP